METQDIFIFPPLLYRESSTLSSDRAVILTRVMVENPLRVEVEQRFLGKAQAALTTLQVSSRKSLDASPRHTDGTWQDSVRLGILE